MDANNTFKVFDWLWTSGQISDNDIRTLAAEGFDAIINLTTPDSPGALQGEAALVTAFHLNYFQIPVDWENPEFGQFLLFVRLIEALRDQKIWLHCAMNMRVSVFVYLYRKFILHENEADAIHPLLEVWTPNEVWQDFMHEVSEHYNSKA